MSTVEAPPRGGAAARLQRRAASLSGQPPEESPGSARRQPWALWVGLLLVGAFLMRVWGVEHGLPYAYNADENAHFVPHAIGMFGHALYPNYFVNPPAYTYVLHFVYAIWFGGREGVQEQFAADPTAVWVIARVTAAFLGTLAVWLLYLAGARLFDRRTGLLAAGLLAVAFLPVFYSHLALNDVPLLAPLCLALWGVSGVLRHGRTRDYAIAGAGLGLACATKYTGGIVLLPILGVAALHLSRGGRGRVARDLAVAGGVSLVAFVVANPYAVLDFGAFWESIIHQSDASGDSAGKLGATQDNGYLYYLWSLTWGVGWVPALAAAAGAAVLAVRRSPLALLIVPAPVLYLLFMGSQERFFGRWLMPILPFICLLAAFAALAAVDRLGARRPALRPTLLAVAVVAICGQGLVYSLHEGLVLSRTDTRNLARDWLVRNVPIGEKIVVEPVVPDAWATDIGDPEVDSATDLPGNGRRWRKWATSRSFVDPGTGEAVPEPGIIVNIEDYERVLYPELVSRYENAGYCWVISGSTQRGRAEAEPEKVPRAIAYYEELERRATVAYQASPYVDGLGPVEFNFDFAFNQYPLAYYRPGPMMTIYRLHGGLCAPGRG